MSISDSSSEHIEGGYLLLPRRITESSLYAMNGNDLKLAVLFMCLANFEPRKWPDRFQQKEIIIGRGEFVGTHKQWADKTALSLKETRNGIKRLCWHGFLEDLTPENVKRAHGYTHLRICKYEVYQNPQNYVRHSKGIGGANNGHSAALRRAHYINKDKKENNDKNGNKENTHTIPAEVNNSKNVEHANDTGNRVFDKAIPFTEIIESLNTITRKDFNPDEPIYMKLIEPIWKAGYRSDDFKKMFKNMTRLWGKRDEMNVHLCPQTLLKSVAAFEKYLNAKKKPSCTDVSDFEGGRF